MNTARLRRSSDIAAAQRSGRSVRDGSFTARLLSNALDVTRLAVSAPRTVGRSTVRSRARRRVREAFRLAAASADPISGQDVVVTVRREAVSADFSELRAAAEAALRAGGTRS